ncbi:MAG: SRPBCC domain-containing protein [Chloroflexota bacterium]|nr:SRPBCC domain-containing protein [Chloroflexota bacterium]
MKLEHCVQTEARKEVLWAVLQDFERVASCLPGVQDVREVSQTTYEGNLQVRIGPMGVNLSGVVALEEDKENSVWRMTIRAQDRKIGGGARAIVEAVAREETSGETSLTIFTDIQLIGRLGELGQPLIKRKADTLFKEFSDNLKSVVDGSSPVH